MTLCITANATDKLGFHPFRALSLMTPWQINYHPIERSCNVFSNQYATPSWRLKSLACNRRGYCAKLTSIAIVKCNQLPDIRLLVQTWASVSVEASSVTKLPRQQKGSNTAIGAVCRMQFCKALGPYFFCNPNRRPECRKCNNSALPCIAWGRPNWPDLFYVLPPKKVCNEDDFQPVMVSGRCINQSSH